MTDGFTLHPEAEIPDPYLGEILRGVVGSSAHGLSVGTDDLDLMGVRIERIGEMVSLGKPFEQYIYRSAGGSNPSRPGDVDLVVYGLRKFVGLCAKGNPTTLNLLFVPKESCTIDTWEAQALRDLVPHLLSLRVGKCFLGYMTQQRERLMSVRGQKRSGKIRQELIERHGFDTKYAGHVIRLGMQGVEIMTTGKISLPMREDQRSYVRMVRNGEVSLQHVIQMADLLEKRIERLIETNPLGLPPHPDEEEINYFLKHTYRDEWELV